MRQFEYLSTLETEEPTSFKVYINNIFTVNYIPLLV